MTTARDLLQAARDRIRDPARWTQGAGARNAGGQALPFPYTGGTCWCATGALEVAGLKAKVSLDNGEWSTALRCLALQSIWAPDRRDPDIAARSSLFPANWVAMYNDSKAHAEVLALFDRAIAALPP